MTEVFWRRSSKCGSSACLEFTQSADRVIVRDAKEPHGVELEFDAAAWSAFVSEICRGGLRQQGE
ncbi:DUF397 domain-containing protein [Dactylosporangium sucinum]|uniref:DUF397 domain-containing protein n=1 Tax=Dactylosporangium sucinum TaxID=1424081 RepID=A0A917WMU4_9ACTN|nr:DUF397 domain-containing protein [Dactylosporangium sucinum]GGM15834.1 hypothetical protein GCM10007977_016270 [Dactylosporangium sucinum]